MNIINNIKSDKIFNGVLCNNSILSSPMDQFEIKPFFGEFLGLNYTPIGLLTNIMVYIGLVVTFTLFFYLYGTFKENIKLNG
jgi:hypothetical protein